MKHHEDIFQGFGGVELFYQSWLPEVNVKAVVIIIHGGGDHSGRFGNVVDHLVPEHYAVYAFDLRGHGRSPGIRGHINNWSELRDDLGLFIRLVHGIHPTIPLFLFGHSMGGVIVLDYCLRNTENVSGVVCTSPAIGQLGISPILWQLAKLLNLVWPSLSMSTGLDISKLSHHKDFVLNTKRDPLYHRKATPRFGMEVQQTVEFIHHHAAEFSLPMFLIHGTSDEIVSLAGSQKFVGKSNSPLLKYKEYKGGYHELFNDTVKEQVLEDISNWISNQINK